MNSTFFCRRIDPTGFGSGGRTCWGLLFFILDPVWFLCGNNNNHELTTILCFSSSSRCFLCSKIYFMCDEIDAGCRLFLSPTRLFDLFLGVMVVPVNFSCRALARSVVGTAVDPSLRTHTLPNGQNASEILTYFGRLIGRRA